MSRASEGVILTAERIDERAFFEARPERTAIPAFMVRAVVHAPGGAAPGSCFPLYDTEEAEVAAYLEAAGDEESLRAHLAAWAGRDSAARGSRKESPA